MVVEQQYDQINGRHYIARAMMRESTPQQLMAALNALKESIDDSVTKGASVSQEYIGHSHDHIRGGGPITRGLVLSMDSGDTPMESFADITNKEARSYKIPVSPGLGALSNERAVYEVRFRYKVQTEPVVVQWGGGQTMQLEPFAEADRPIWQRTSHPIWITDGWGDLHLLVDTLDGGTFDLYAIHVWETYEWSMPRIGSDDYMWQTQASGATILSYFDVLDNILCQAGDSFDAETYKRCQSAVNALYSYILDAPPPGTSTQAIKGHDHHSSGYGGGSVPMACIYSAGSVDNPLWTETLTTQNTWYYVDTTATSRRTTGTPAGTPTTVALYEAWVSPGITSSGAPPSTHPYTQAHITFSESGTGGTFEFRLYQIGTTTHSAALSVTSDSGGFGKGIITFIPCVGNSLNLYALEARCTSHASRSVNILTINHAEIVEWDETTISLSASSGDQPLAVSIPGRRVA